MADTKRFRTGHKVIVFDALAKSYISSFTLLKPRLRVTLIVREPPTVNKMPISKNTYHMLREAVKVENGMHLARLEQWLDSVEQKVERPQPREQQKKGHDGRGHRRNLSVRIPVEDLPSLNPGHSTSQLSSPEPKSYIPADPETPIDCDNNGPLKSPLIRIHLTLPTPASEPDHDKYFDALEWISAEDDAVSAVEPPFTGTIRLQNLRSFDDNQDFSAGFFYRTATSSRHYPEHADNAEDEPVQEWFFDKPTNSWVRPALLIQNQDSINADACSDDNESLIFGSKDEQASAEVLEQRVQMFLKESRLRQFGVNELLDRDSKEYAEMLEQRACELEMFLEEDWLEQMLVSDLIESIDRELEADAVLEQSLFDDLDASYLRRAKPGRRTRPGR